MPPTPPPPRLLAWHSSWSRPSWVIRKDSQHAALLLVRSSPETGHLQRGGWCDVLGDAWPPLPVSRELAWQDPWPCCVEVRALWQPQRLRGMEGVARRAGAGVTSVAITSHFSLQPRQLQSTEIVGRHLPSWLFWAEDGLGCFCSCSPDAITKSLQWTRTRKRLMPYVSVLPLKSVPGLSVFIALTLDSPRARSGPPRHASLTPGLRRHGARGKGALWGPRTPEGWAGTFQPHSPLIWILPR